MRAEAPRICTDRSQNLYRAVPKLEASATIAKKQGFYDGKLRFHHYKAGLL